jgi:hypothetical protein
LLQEPVGILTEIVAPVDALPTPVFVSYSQFCLDRCIESRTMLLWSITETGTTESFMNFVERLVALFKEPRHGLLEEKPPRAPAQAPFVEEDNFQEMLQRARYHADRTGDPFALLVLEFDEHSTSREWAVKIWQSNASPRQTADSRRVGWLSPQSLGMILPNTSFIDAHEMAEELFRALPQARLFCSYKIFTYPPRVS